MLPMGKFYFYRLKDQVDVTLLYVSIHKNVYAKIFKLNAKIYFIPDELKTNTDLMFKPEKKNGETYWIVQKFGNKFHPKKMSMYFEGIINGERRLSKI